MRSRFVKSAAAVMAAACIVLGSGAPVMAAANGSTTQIANYMKIGSYTPDASFSYTVSAGTPVSAEDNGGVPVLAGVEPDNVAIGSTKFTSGASKVTLNGSTYVLGYADVDFSQVSFPDAGIYRYVIEETDSGVPGVGYDTANTTAGAAARKRYLDVYVTYDNTTGDLKTSSYALHDTLTGSVKDGKLSDKSAGFYNEYQLYRMLIENSYAGTNAPDSKMLLYHVSIEGALPGTTLVVTAQDLDTDTSADANDTTLDTYKSMDAYKNAADPADLTVDSTGKTEGDFLIRGRYGKNGTALLITGLPKNAKFTVKETNEDFTTKVTADSTTSSGSSYSGTISSDAVLSYTNTRDFPVPTGIRMGLLPYLIIAACAGAAVIAVTKRKRGEKS